MSDDDFDIPEDEEFEDLEEIESKQVLKELWQKPIIKLLVFALGVLIVISAISYYFRGEEEIVESAVTGGADVSQPPGEEVTPIIKEAIEQVNEERAERAEQTTTLSAMPTPVGSPKQMLEAPENPDTLPEDPLQEWRRAVEIRDIQPFPEEEDPDFFQNTDEEEFLRGVDPLDVGVEVTPVVEPITPDISGPGGGAGAVAASPENEALAGLLAQQMNAIISAQTIPTSQTIQVMQPIFDRESGGEGGTGQAGGAGARAGQFMDGEEGFLEDEPTSIITVGDIDYVQLLTELNSDIPGPAMAQILSGPFTGGRMMGSFSKVTGADDFLVITFDTIIFNRKVYSMSGIAMDPDTTLTAVVTDVNKHYFKRVILPAAISFVEGVAEAVGETSTSVTPLGGAGGDTPIVEEEELDEKEELARGAEEALGVVSEFLQEEADNTEVTVKVAAGTPMGVLYLNSVSEDDRNE